MANIINKETKTEAQKKAQRILDAVKQAANAQLKAYKTVREEIYGPDADPFTVSKVQQNWADFMANQNEITPEELGGMARIAKASLNLFSPGTINDGVPEAVITFTSDVEPSPPADPVAPPAETEPVVNQNNNPPVTDPADAQ